MTINDYILATHPNPSRLGKRRRTQLNKLNGNNNLIKKDLNKGNYPNIKPNKLNTTGDVSLNDFTIRSNPKDTLVMAGGTRFGEETNKLLRELISAVKEGGDVVMDGNKVGQAINLAAYRTTTA